VIISQIQPVISFFNSFMQSIGEEGGKGVR
jgi:hypothetical protein